MAGDDAMRGDRLRKAVLEYLGRHPEASDTATGIVSWWLPATGYEDAAAHIDEVLDALVQDALMVRRLLPDGGVLYAARRPGIDDDEARDTER